MIIDCKNISGNIEVRTTQFCLVKCNNHNILNVQITGNTMGQQKVDKENRAGKKYLKHTANQGINIH